MTQALKRLFLILFPLSLFCLALFLANTKSPLQQKNKLPPAKKQKDVIFLNSSCPFYFGFSFFSIEGKKENISKNKKASLPLTTYILSKQNFSKKLQDLKKELQRYNISLEKVFFILPLVLTKDKKWLISEKTFFILPTGEKKEISHLNYSETEKIHKNLTKNKTYTALKLSEALSDLPDNHFLFSIEGSNRENLIEKLNNSFMKNLKGDIYFTSSNEQLLTEIAVQTHWKTLHSFKSLIRFQMMKIFHINSWKNLPGQGFLIPSSFSLSNKDLEFLKEQKKLLFFKKDPPYDLSSQNLIHKVRCFHQL